MDYLGKGEMLTNRDENTFVHNVLEKKHFVSIEHFWDLVFQHMKHGTKTLFFAFYIFDQCS